MKLYFSIIVIVIIAGLLRFIGLIQVPPALNSDEVAIGYNAYSILTTGRDEYGIRYPLTFRSFDDYKMPVYVYLVAGSMKLFGFGDFAVRLPSALFGTLSVLATYFLVLQLLKLQAPSTNNQIISKSKAQNAKQNDLQKLAHFSAMLLAISPWHIHFSRSGYEANVAVFFIVAATYFFLKKSYIISSVLFSLSIWTYLTPRIFVPLFVLGLACIYRKEIWTRRMSAAAGIIVALILLAPIVKMSLSAEGQIRAAGVSAFANPDDLKKSAARIVRDQENGFGMLTVLDNRRISYGLTFLRGYFAHFDPNYLFLDKSIEKYRAPDMGLLYLFELPLLAIGIYLLIRQRSKATLTLFWWVVVSPVAAAFTLQLPHPVRTLVFLPTFQIISAVGLAFVWERFRGFKWAIGGIIVFSLVYYLHQYFAFLPVEHGSQWYVGRREMTQKIAAVEHDYDTIYVSNALDFPYIFYLYYRPVNPKDYLAQGGTITGGFLEQGNKYGNIEFRSISTSLHDPLKKTLFVGLPSEVFKTSLIVDTVYYPDGAPAIVFFK